MSLGSIVVRLSMNTADFETDAGRAAKTAERRAKEIDASFRKAGVAIGLALGAAVVGITAAVKGSIDKMDDLSKAAQRVGLPTEEFSRLAYAGSLADVEVETLVSTLGKLTKAQAAAYNSTSQQAKVFDALGISAFDAGGKMRSSTDVLTDFADKFQQMEGSPEIMAAGFALFGRSFQDMIPLLKDGAAGLRSAADEADALGITLSTEAGKAAEEFNDNLTRMQTAVNGAWQEIAIGMLPQLNSMSGDLVEASKNTEMLRSAGAGLMALLSGLGAVFGTVTNMARQFGVDMAAAAQIAEGFIEVRNNAMTFGASEGSMDGGRKKVKDAIALRQEMLDGFKRQDAKAKAQAGIDTLLRNAKGVYNGPLLEPSKFAGKDINADALRKALGNVAAPKAPKAKAAGGASDAAREAEAAKRAYEEAMRAQNSWHDSILDMAASLAGPVAQVNREYESNIAKLAADYDAGKVALKDYATAQELYGQVRDRDLKAINDRKSPAQQMLEDMKFEMELIGKTREQQELLTAARYLGVEAMTAQGQAALTSMAAFQQADKATRDQIELMDAFRNGAVDAITDFVTGAATAEEALKSFAAAMAATVARMIAQKWIEQLFGQTGSSSGGSSGWGGIISSLAGALFGGGKAEGGYTGPGGKHEYAGPVHKGEVVWSQADVARSGGVGAVESARMTGGGVGGGSSKPQRIVLVDNQKDGEAMLRSSTGEDAILVHIGNNAGAIRELLA